MNECSTRCVICPESTGLPLDLETILQKFIGQTQTKRLQQELNMPRHIPYRESEALLCNVKRSGM